MLKDKAWLVAAAELEKLDLHPFTYITVVPRGPAGGNPSISITTPREEDTQKIDKWFIANQDELGVSSGLIED